MDSGGLSQRFEIKKWELRICFLMPEKVKGLMGDEIFHYEIMGESGLVNKPCGDMLKKSVPKGKKH